MGRIWSRMLSLKFFIFKATIHSHFHLLQGFPPHSRLLSLMHIFRRNRKAVCMPIYFFCICNFCTQSCTCTSEVQCSVLTYLVWYTIVAQNPHPLPISIPIEQAKDLEPHREDNQTIFLLEEQLVWYVVAKHQQ